MAYSSSEGYYDSEEYYDDDEGYTESEEYTDSQEYTDESDADSPECEWCGASVGYWPSGNRKRYCDLECRRSHVNGELCLFCRQVPKWMDPGLKRPRDFCGQVCRKRALDQGPLLLEVDSNSRSFQSVRDQFKNSWRHSDKEQPDLIRLFKVISERETHERYIDHRDYIEEQRGFLNRRGRQTPGNERRRFHGTERRCQIGDPRHSTAKFCKSRHCRLCAILRSSFDLSRFGQNTDFGRFGTGIYTTSTSSKADDYAVDTASPFRAYILAKVVLGEPYVAWYNNQQWTSPPFNHDSVVGQPGGSLVYDEAVVYDEDAIRPYYLLICSD